MGGTEWGTETLSRRRAVLQAGALTAGAVSWAGCLSLGTSSPDEQVAEHRDNWEKYTDLRTALHDGYQTTAEYQTTDNGIIGEALVNNEIDTTAPEQPPVLLYNLTEKGQYKLAGAEWFSPAADTSSPPSLFGKSFEGPIQAVTGLPRRYVLRVWFTSDNPDGLFALANSSLTAPAFIPALTTARDALRPVITGVKAEEKGYVNTERCVELADGGYGVPFVREDPNSTTDIEAPPLLLYQLTANWNYTLMGAEWWIDDGGPPPDLFGATWHDPLPAHSPDVNRPDHRGLHAWLFRANPDGLFALTHPLVTCN